MTYLIFHSLYILFFIIELALYMYIFLSWLPNTESMRNLMFRFLEPIFIPLRACLHRSVFSSSVTDLTPLVALIFISFMRALFNSLSM